MQEYKVSIRSVSLKLCEVKKVIHAEITEGNYPAPQQIVKTTLSNVALCLLDHRTDEIKAFLSA